LNIIKLINLPIDQQTQIFMIKPDGVKRNLESNILKILRGLGFMVLCKKEKMLSKDDVKLIYKTTFVRDYPNGEDDPRADKHIQFMRSGPCIGMLVRHNKLTRPELYNYSKGVRGESWLPIKCSKDSIRYKLRNEEFDNYIPQYSEDKYLMNQVPENILHASLSDEELANLYNVFFKEFSINFDFIPNDFSTLEKKSVDLILVVTNSMSSSDKMKIKMHCGISHLQAFLFNHGYNVKIKAFGEEEPQKIAEELISLRPKIIGFSTVASEFKYVSQISRLIRKIDPTILLVGGGPHFTLFPQDILATNLDTVCVGEGELPLLDLLMGKEIQESRNWVFREDSRIVINDTNPFIQDISSLPIPDHRLWNEYSEQKYYPHRRILTSRGCPYSCTYCSNRPLSQVSKGIYTRFRSPKSIEDEIIHIIENFPTTEYIFFESEILHPQFANIEEILKITNKYQKRLKFGTNLRVEVINYEYFHSLQTNGFDFAYIGLESGSEYIRKKILKRKYSNQDVINVFSAAKRANFKVNTYNLVGLPEETKRDFNETISLNQICQPNEAQLSIFFPYPGTELYYLSLDKGYIQNPFFHHYFDGKERRSPTLKMNNFTEDEIINSYWEFRSIFG